jgi:hypothetical protein
MQLRSVLRCICCSRSNSIPFHSMLLWLGAVNLWCYSTFLFSGYSLLYLYELHYLKCKNYLKLSIYTSWRYTQYCVVNLMLLYHFYMPRAVQLLPSVLYNSTPWCFPSAHDWQKYCTFAFGYVVIGTFDEIFFCKRMDLRTLHTKMSTRLSLVSGDDEFSTVEVA